MLLGSYAVRSRLLRSGASASSGNASFLLVIPKIASGGAIAALGQPSSFAPLAWNLSSRFSFQDERIPVVVEAFGRPSVRRSLKVLAGLPSGAAIGALRPADCTRVMSKVADASRLSAASKAIPRPSFPRSTVIGCCRPRSLMDFDSHLRSLRIDGAMRLAHVSSIEHRIHGGFVPRRECVHQGLGSWLVDECGRGSSSFNYGSSILMAPRAARFKSVRVKFAKLLGAHGSFRVVASPWLSVPLCRLRSASPRDIDSSPRFAHWASHFFGRFIRAIDGAFGCSGDIDKAAHEREWR